MDVPNEIDKSSTYAKGNSIAKDRLSSLPNEVIHHILSFLDARFAVQYSVLSKHWKDLWKSLPVLNFNDRHFSDPIDFQDFVEHFISSRNPSSKISMLNLECHDELDDGYIVDFIIDNICSTDIKVLSILADCVIQDLPLLSTARNLTTLMLTNIAYETTTFNFVSLQQLYLVDCNFECPVEEVLDLFSGCPNLQYLFLHGSHYSGRFKKFKIHAPQLKGLSISYLRVNEEFNPSFVIELFTPKLQSLSYDDDKGIYPLSVEANLPLVEKVNINVSNVELSKELMKTRDTNLPLKLIKLFEAMRSAKFISLSPSIIQVLSVFPALLDGQPTPFTKVHTFQLIKDGSSPFPIPTNVITYLFGASPTFDG